MGDDPFSDLIDTDGWTGKRVVQGVNIPISNSPSTPLLGFERLQSSISIAVHPRNSDVVYVAWGDGNNDEGIYTVHVRHSVNRGTEWDAEDLQTIPNATCFSLAVTEDGTVGLLYQQLVDNRWDTRLEQTADGFATISSTLLASTANERRGNSFPVIGDYNYLLAHGRWFHGVFSADNIPDSSYFPAGIQYQRRVDFESHRLLDQDGNEVLRSIDPFYFRVKAIP
jgi:hypothetical protein